MYNYSINKKRPGKPGFYTTLDPRAAATWRDFCRLFEQPLVTKHKDGAGYVVGGIFNQQYRHGSNHEHSSILAIDIDNGGDDIDAHISDEFFFENHVGHSTFSNSEGGKQKRRLYFPLSRPVNAHEYEYIARVISHRIGADVVDIASVDCIQLMFRPAVKPGHENEYIYYYNEGFDDVDVDAMLVDGWEDMSTWPLIGRETEVKEHIGRTRSDPRDFSGPQGAFHRCYDVHRTIDEFLSDVYERTEDHRYNYLAGSGRPAARVYDDDQQLHSDHTTDPAHGQHNAFELLQIHKFGGSYTDTLNFVTGLPEVRDRLLEDVDAVFDEDGEDVEAAGAGDPHVQDINDELDLLPVIDHGIRQEIKPADYVIDDVLPAGEVTLFYGNQGSYKSYTLMDMCLSVATGEKWAGRDVRKGLVMYVCGEGANTVNRRVEAWRKDRGYDLTPGFYSTSVPVGIMTPKEHKRLLRTMRHIEQQTGGKFELVVVDTVSRNFGGHDRQENSNEDMAHFVQCCEKICAATGAAVSLVHHKPKSGTGARGGGALANNAYAEYEIERDPENRQRFHLHNGKLKSGPENESMTFGAEVHVVGYDPEKKRDITDIAFRLVDEFDDDEDETPEITIEPGKIGKALRENIVVFNEIATEFAGQPVTVQEYQKALRDRIDDRHCRKNLTRDARAVGAVTDENESSKILLKIINLGEF